MNSWKIILATIVIFGAGVMSGGLLVSHVDRASRNDRRPPDMAEFHPPGGEHGPGRGMDFFRPRQPDILNTNFVMQLNDALKLSAEQKSAVTKIITEGQQRNRDIWRTNAMPPIRQVMIETRQQIRQLLTPEQQKQFDDLMRRPPHRPGGFGFPPQVLPPTNAPVAAPPNGPGACLHPPFNSARISLRNCLVTESTDRLASTMVKS